MTNEQAISEIKDLIVYTLEKKEALKMAVKALEQMDRVKMVTKDNIRNWWSNNSRNSPEGLDGRLVWTNSDVFDFAKYSGILIEEPKKVKKWIWTSSCGKYKTAITMSLEEAEKEQLTMELNNWTKDESSCIEVDE